MAEDSTTGALSALLDQGRQLYTSLVGFKEAAAAQHTPIEVRSYLRYLKGELRVLERLLNTARTMNTTTSSAESDMDDSHDDTEEGSHDGFEHSVKSSNLRYIQSVWDMAKRCTHVVALSSLREDKSNPREDKSYPREDKSNSSVNQVTLRRKKTYSIDVIANMGLLWIKILTIGERKLLFELAKEGWHESDSETEDGGIDVDLPLLEMIKNLVSIAQSPSSKVHYRCPELLIYFPNIEEDKITFPVIHKIIASIRATGATVHCGSGDILLRDSTLLALPSSVSETGHLQQMLPLIRPNLTSTLNLDCTILLALISDLSNQTLDENSVYNESLKRQLAMERAQPLLSGILYPALKGRKLIASHLAVQRMWEIVDTLGTPDEKTRAAICFQQNTFSKSTAEDLRNEFQKLSTHTIPSDLQFPIEVMDSETTVKSTLSEVESLLLPELSKMNYSVFMLGWRQNVTTVTSNRVVARRIESIIHQAPDEVQGPDMWLVDTARSLVGKERNRR